MACLLELGADVNGTTFYDDETPLQYAAHYCHQGVLELLVKHGANINVCDQHGCTALHYAVDDRGSGDRLKAAKFLVAQGCRVDAHDMFGFTPLDTAKHLGDHPQLEEFLLAASHARTTNNDHYLASLCAPFSNPHFEKLTGKDLVYEFLLCLEATKKAQIGGSIAPSDFAGITLTSQIYDHEKGLVRLILSFVGTKQESIASYATRFFFSKVPLLRRKIATLEEQVLRLEGEVAASNSKKRKAAK
jgi:ankyrin repeat protein